MPLHIGSATCCSGKRIGVRKLTFRAVRQVAVSEDYHINALHRQYYNTYRIFEDSVVGFLGPTGLVREKRLTQVMKTMTSIGYPT